MSFFSPLKSQIRVVLGQHSFNTTSPNTRTFGVEDYIFPRHFSVFNPTLHDIGNYLTHTHTHAHTYASDSHKLEDLLSLFRNTQTHLRTQSVCTAVLHWTAVSLCTPAIKTRTNTDAHIYVYWQLGVAFPQGEVSHSLHTFASFLFLFHNISFLFGSSNQTEEAGRAMCEENPVHQAHLSPRQKHDVPRLLLLHH